MLQVCGWAAYNAHIMGAEVSALSRRGSDSSEHTAVRVLFLPVHQEWKSLI